MPTRLAVQRSAESQTALPSGGSRSFTPPTQEILASDLHGTARNGNAEDKLNDALTDGYVPHENDPALPTDEYTQHLIYGPKVTGPTFHQGESDQRAIAANDVHQSAAVGNCYFLAALAGLAQQQPELIRNAIEGPLNDGTYNVTLYYSTGWNENREMEKVTINIAPSFVVIGDPNLHPLAQKSPLYKRRFANLGGRDAFASHADRDEQGNMELWVQLIEKAQAKLWGNWDEVSDRGGWPSIALEVLTGQAHQEFYFNGLPDFRLDDELEDFARPSSVIEGMDTEALKRKIIDNLGNRNVVVAEDKGHAVTVMEATDDYIELRDQLRAKNDSDGRIRLTWEEFEAKYIKITTLQEDREVTAHN